MRRLVLAWVMAATCLSGTAATASERPTRHDAARYSGIVSHVSDGDTLWVRRAGGGRPRKIRLHGIDAPEICQTHGAAAKAALERLVLHQEIAVSELRLDDYQRPVARIARTGQDVARAMVLQGHAWSYRYRRDLGPYAQEEAQARQGRRGLFAAAQPELPRTFRRRHGSCGLP